jgi:SAM-dependent MidA family methyltransferase
MQPHNLPPPPPEALALSNALVEQINMAIRQANGWLPFDAYMELALYSPGLGYYANGLHKFGPGGDFITAPELGPLFGQCLAWQCHETLNALGGGDILECGPGSGRLAVNILSTLKTLKQLPNHYYLLEPSASLAARQQALIQQSCPELAERAVWLTTLPKAFCGLILANEVADAMATSRFRLGAQGAEEAGVEIGRQGLESSWRPLSSPGLAEALAQIASLYHIHPTSSSGYQSEINLRARAWGRALAESLQQGLILICDYGYSGQELYHPQRSQGTLLCHYQHHSHNAPLLWPGLCDITSSVDFTALAQAGRTGGCDSQAFSSQAHFLLNTHLDHWLAQQMEQGGTQAVINLQAAKRLTLPNEMGERFRVLGLGKGLDQLPSGFQMQRYSL